MDEQLVYRIKTLYDQKVLTPKLGEGTLKTDLLNGLEGVLRDTPVEATPNQILDQKIDYAAIQSQKDALDGKHHYHTVAVTRLRNSLRNKQIETYKDLVAYAGQKQSKRKLPTMQGVRVLGIRHMGRRVSILLYKHLNSLGINLFSDGYRHQELR